MTTTIGSVVLAGIGGAEGSGGDLQWQDEFAAGSDLVGMVGRVSITGAPIYQASAQQSGRLMTLAGGNDNRGYFGVITRAEVLALYAIAAVPGEEYEITLADGREFTGMFRRTDGPAFEAIPLEHMVPHESTDLYVPTIRLVLV